MSKTIPEAEESIKAVFDMVVRKITIRILQVPGQDPTGVQILGEGQPVCFFNH